MEPQTRTRTDAAIARLLSSLMAAAGLGVARYMPITPRNPAAADAMAMARAAPRAAPAGVVQLPHRHLEQRRPRAFPGRGADRRPLDRLHGRHRRRRRSRSAKARRRQARHPSVGARLHRQDADRQRRRQGRAACSSTGSRSTASPCATSTALVVPDEALSTNLLGMTFLSRVKWTHDRGRLVLEQ